MATSVAINVHGHRVELAGYGETWIKDNDYLYFGDSLDVAACWDGTDLDIIPLTDNAGAINFGNGTKDIDVKIFLGATTDYAEFDISAGRLTMEGAEIRFGDSDKLEFGDGGDITALWDGIDFHFATIADDKLINVGDGTLSLDLKWFGSVAANYLYFDCSADTLYYAATHFLIETDTDGKNVRINSRDYTQASGSASAVQIKPSQNDSAGTSTASVTGLEVSPRFQAGKAGGDLRAILADPLLKAGSGNLSGQVVGVECNIDFGTSGTRTITGDISAFSSFLAIPSTYTYSGAISFLRVRDVNIKGWDYLINFDSTGVGMVVATAGTYSTADGYIKILIGSTAYRIPYFAAVD